jgi:phosphoglycolate phosphatase-like HAD superfamily hydrolase
MSSKISLAYYQNILFDFDGVLLDSNVHKRRNIMAAVSRYCSQEKARAFTDYFAQRSGIPREGKVRDFFPPPEAEMILADYGRRNECTLVEAEVTPGAEELLDSCSRRGALSYVISGGTQKETFDVLVAKGLAEYFLEVRGGPLTKEENWQEMSVSGSSVYLGDSQADHEFSVAAHIDFVFLYEFTAFTGWETYFRAKPGVRIAKNLCDLDCGIPAADGLVREVRITPQSS